MIIIADQNGDLLSFARSSDEEILRAMSGAMRQIEDELTEGHEVLTREPAPVLLPSRWLLRAGSGVG